MTNRDYEWEEKYARVVRTGAHIEFFNRVFNAHDIRSLVIVSPWIGVLDVQEVGYTIGEIAELISRDKIPTHIITRSPRAAPSNAAAVDIFMDCATVNLFYNDELHAKVYVCRCSPSGFALLSSANLSSSSAITSVEIGLMIDGRGYGDIVLEELESFGKLDIPGMTGTRVAKYAKRFSHTL